MPELAPPPIEQYEQLLAAKAARVAHLLADVAGPVTRIVPSAPEGFRMRAEFRIWHEGSDTFYAMFDPQQPKIPLRVQTFPIAHPRIQSLMPELLSHVQREDSLRRRLFQAEFLCTTRGEALITLIYHRPLDEQWEAAAGALASALQVSVIGRSRREKRVIGSDYLSEHIAVHDATYQYRQYEQSFTQPNAGINRAMLEWACDAARDLGGDLLELYCGNGNFTIPLSRHFDAVIATEVAKLSTRAAMHNLEANAIDNVSVVRLAAEEISTALRGERSFRRLGVLPRPLQAYRLDTVLVDPPRAGLDDGTVEMLRRFRHVLYISCNPQTLRDNLDALGADFEAQELVLFDQFPYTGHMECAVLLRART
jgi:tRNA (uracil-5-)-methyltransferase